MQNTIAADFGIDAGTALRLVALGESYERELQSLLLEAHELPFGADSSSSLEKRRMLAAQRHRKIVADLVGTKAFEKMDRWLDSELRQRVQAFKMNRVDSSPATVYTTKRK
jgi:hypothetical protein